MKTLEPLTKVCRSCGTPFQSEPHWGKEYCSLKCRNREKRHRHKRRDNGIEVHTESQFYADVPNPTIEQLSTYADMIAKELTDDKPVRFYGNVPMWTAPSSVIFHSPSHIQPVEWHMFHPAMLE